MIQYVLGPWVWDDSDPETPFYRAPTGTVGLVDLRPVAPSLTMGFFATTIALGSDYTAFGDGVNRLEDVALTPQQRSLWSSALGIGAISGNRLIDALWETLTLYGDPDGGVICPPLMPTHRGILELHLGGHSLIRNDRFTGPQHPAWPRIQALVQRNYRAIRTEAMRNHRGPGAPTIHSKYLECMRRKLRCPWEDLIPGDLPRERPMRPDTTVTDDFNRANESLDAGNWTEASGNWSVTSNEATDSAAGYARYGTALSSDDMYSQLNMGAIGRGAGPCARFDTGSITLYSLECGNTSGSVPLAIVKVVSGTRTSLTNKTKESQSLLNKLEVSGSSLEAFVDGVSELTLTDTAVSGYTSAGIGDTFGSRTMDNFEAADLVAASGNPWYAYQQ